MKKFNTIDEHEATVAKYVALNCTLSGYIGTSSLGGHQCEMLEQEWSEVFHVKHSVAVNSATSGLLAACMAVGVSYGDEVIVSPYTMSATAAAPKLLGAKLRWADIEMDTFCIDPVEVANLITGRTRAVICTNLFGHPCQLEALKRLCDDHGIYLIEDNAQAIGAMEDDRYAGTMGHIGVFSLNVHKHIQVGEGGVCCTNYPELDRKLREAMNHGELRPSGILGLNLRMTEVTAAMAREQLKKLPTILASRIAIAEQVSFEMLQENIPVRLPIVRDKCTHSYYCWAGLMDKELNVVAPFKRGYLHPLYSLAAFRERETVICPACEEAESKIMLLEICSIDPTENEIRHMVELLKK